MTRCLAVVVGVALSASLFLESAVAENWADRISEVRDQAHAEVREAVADSEHARAKELIRARDQRLKAILAEFEEAGEQALPEADVIAVIQAYELLWQWERALELASAYVAEHPKSEAAYMAIFRCLLNLGRADEAADLLKDIEGGFPAHSPVQFVHSMLAPRYQQQQKWDLVLEHSEIAARRRISVLRTHHRIARWALFDFRRITEAAIAMEETEEGAERLRELMGLLDEVLVELAHEPASASVFVKECAAHQLRTDIAYWLGADEVAAPFRQWIEFIVEAWRTESVPPRIVRQQAVLAARYLERQGGVLTPEMLDTLEYLKQFVDDRRSKSPQDESLARLSRRCQRLIEGQVFRPQRDREPFGGIGP